MVLHPPAPGDVRLVLDRGPGAVVRLAASPVFTVLASVFEVVLGWRRGGPVAWVDFVRRGADDTDLGALRAFDTPARAVPNFVLPVPPRGSGSFADEVATVRATPPDRVRADLEAVFDDEEIPSSLRAYVEDPAAALDDLGDCLARYWAAVIGPRWPRMRAVIEREILVRSRQLGTEGLGAVLSSLHPRLALVGGELRYPSPSDEQLVTPLGDRELVLVPMICGHAGLITSDDRDDAVVIAYAAPGAAEVWAPHRAGPGSALDGLLGPTRATLLRAISEPSTTTNLAGQLGLAPGTVSHHLTALVGVGAADRSRVGPHVYYALTERGASLLGLFED